MKESFKQYPLDKKWVKKRKNLPGKGYVIIARDHVTRVKRITEFAGRVAGDLTIPE